MATLDQLLAAIERDNAKRFKSPAHRTLYSGGKGPAPYTHSKSVAHPVEPKTSSGQASDGTHSGVLGTVRNLANDVENTVRGIPGGVIQTIHDPIGTVKAVGKDYARRYSPLVHGDFGKFASEIQAHPLAPLLDLASVATAGGAVAGKIGQSAAVAGKIRDAAITSEAKATAKLAETTAPLKKSVDSLSRKVEKTQHDAAAAQVRATTVHPDKIAAAVKPFKAKITKLESQVTAEQQGIANAKALIAKPKSRKGYRKTDAQQKLTTHQDNITHLQHTIQGVAKDMRAATRAASKLQPDVVKSSVRAFEKHTSTIEHLQSQIADASKAIETATKASTKAAKHAPMSKTISTLVRLQKATSGGYRYIGADKAGAFKGIPVALHLNPVKRLRQNLGIDLQESKLIPQRTPLIGLESRAKKAANLTRDVEAGRTRATQRTMVAAVNTLEKVAGKDKAKINAMSTAAQGLIDGVAPADYARLVKDTRSTADEIQHSIRSGISQVDHHKHTEDLIKPHLDKHANELYHAARQYFQREALNAGRTVDKIHLQHGFSNKLINSKEVKAIVDLQKAHENVAQHAMEQLVKNRMLKPDMASVQAVLHVNLSRQARGLKAYTPAEAKAAYEKAGLPVPSYNPDTLTIGEAGKKTGMLKESKGILYARGTRNNSPMNIILRHELASKATDVAMAHRLMLSASRKIPAGKDLPKGYVWIKDTIDPGLNTKVAMFKTQFADGAALGKDYFKMLEAEKRPTGGYAIRKDVADDLAAGRSAMSAARSETLAKTMGAWKYLVLFRPAFVVHNVVGNQLMYHLKNGWNFAAFHNAKATFSGAFKEHHHSEGVTFSEDVMGKGNNKLTKTLNSFYKVTAVHEHWLRQLTAYETARRMPQVQRELRALKGGKYNPAQHGGRTMLHEAYNRAVAQSPHIRDLVTRNMDDTLGNYRYYTAQERMLKNLSPFYGWERHSVRNMVRMMEDNPATMAMLTQLGMVGHDKWNKDFGPGMPDFVKNYVQDSYIQTVAQHLGIGDQVNMYDFNSVNPWSTAVDVGRAATGDRDATVGLAGPILTGPAEALFKKSALTGAPSQSRFDKRGPLAGGLDRIITSTPPVALFDALTSNKNENKKLLKTTDKGMIARQFGGDFRQLDKPKAVSMQKAKDAPKDKYGNTIQHKKKKKLFYN